MDKNKRLKSGYHQLLTALILFFIILPTEGICIGVKAGDLPPYTAPEIEVDARAAGFIEIIVEGGGIYGGINPTTKNITTINSNGEIVVASTSFYGGSQSDTFPIKKETVAELADFIVKAGFFSMEEVYDCDPGNSKCKDRKKSYPPAVPLTIEVAIDDLKKKVTVTVYEPYMVNNPKEFTDIVHQINKVISDARGRNWRLRLGSGLNI